MSTRGIDFAEMELRDALDLAIMIEDEARDRYHELADQLVLHHTPEAAMFFRRMARIEERHRDQLAARRKHAFADAACHVTRSMIFDIEAPAYDEAFAFMTVRQALETALRSEEKAYRFFLSALPHVRDATVRILFEELRAEEVEHQRLVKAELAKLPPDDPGQAADYADEPTSH